MMKDIYKKVLRIARQRVFDDETGKYEKLIAFCKYKLEHCVYQRHEKEIYFNNSLYSLKETKVHVEELPATSFKEYLDLRKIAEHNVIEKEVIFNN